MICEDFPTYGSVGGWVTVMLNSLKWNKSWTNVDNSILFEDLWSVETFTIMGKCMDEWIGDIMSNNQNGINLDLIGITQFCVKIYDQWRLPNL